MPIPPVIGWTVAAVGAVLVAALIEREWRRVQALRSARTAPVTRTARAPIRRLRRDPVTGVYRP